jgi:hypothetical protein
MEFEGLGFSANFCEECKTSWELKKLEPNKKIGICCTIIAWMLSPTSTINTSSLQQQQPQQQQPDPEQGTRPEDEDKEEDEEEDEEEENEEDDDNNVGFSLSDV